MIYEVYSTDKKPNENSWNNEWLRKAFKDQESAIDYAVMLSRRDVKNREDCTHYVVYAHGAEEIATDIIATIEGGEAK